MSAEQIVVAVPESLEGRDAVVAQVEASGALAVTSSELEAMQQQVADTALKPTETLVISSPRHSRLASIAALTAIAGAVAIGHAPPQPFADTTRRERPLKEMVADSMAAAEKIAAAKAKRERKAALRTSRKGGRANG